MNILNVPFECKFNADKPGFFEGYGAVFGNVDKGNDVCVKGCFTDTIAEHKSNKTMPFMRYMHDPKEPIGDWIHMEEDTKGLFVQGQFWINKGIPRAEQAYAMANGTGQKGLSIGYKPTQHKRDKGVRYLQKTYLAEVSVVGDGMNPLALITSVKSASGALDRELVEDVLLKAGMDELQVKAIMAHGWNGLSLPSHSTTQDLVAELRRIIKP